MLNGDRKKAVKAVFSQIAVFAIGLVVLVLISIPLARNVSQRYKINQEIKDLEAEIRSLEQQNSGLNEFLEYLGSEQFVEEQARLNLGLKKQGEEVVVVKNEEGAASAVENGQSENERNGMGQERKETPNPVKWKNYFFKY